MRGLPLAYIMTAGNQAQTGLSELAIAALEDPRVTAVGLHIEGFDSIEALQRLATRARQLKKPVVTLQVGKSEAAQLATVSHTASLAGNDAVSGAVLERFGHRPGRYAAGTSGNLKAAPPASATEELRYLVDELLWRRSIADGRCRGEAEDRVPGSEGRTAPAAAPKASAKW